MNHLQFPCNGNESLIRAHANFVPLYIRPGKTKKRVPRNICCGHMSPQCFPVKPHIVFQQQNMFLLRGRNISPCGNIERHWGNMCPHEMFLSACLLVLPGVIFLKEDDRGAASYCATPYFPSISPFPSIFA